MEPSLYYAAVHEAGHAVLARSLGASVVVVRVDLTGSGEATTSVRWPEGGPALMNHLRVAAAGGACLRAFGFTTLLDAGLFHDEVEIQNALDDLLPHADDDAIRDEFRDRVVSEVEQIFNMAQFRSAVQELAERLSSEGEINGVDAERAIDRHLHCIS
jgi:hypothetical protein